MKKPLPGYEDLYPHVAMLDDPASDMDGEAIVPPRTLALMIAPSVQEALDYWDEHAEAVNAGIPQGHFRLPMHWQTGARRRSNELMAKYDTDIAFEVLRALHREYGCFPPEGKAS
jgi:hypothetical protein